MNGTYGTKKPAFITSGDTNIYYHYRPSRVSDSSDFNGFKTLDSKYLSGFTINDSDTQIPGLYDLKLPISEFSNEGIYTIYITPKEQKLTITDVGTLYTNSGITGIVINRDSLDFSVTNGDLVGYRIEFFNSTTNKRYNDDSFRIITSNNFCEPIASTSSNVQYLLNNSSNLIFCTVTPSVNMSFLSDTDVFIGSKGQTISLINTKFNPIMLEVEMVSHDIETLTTMMEGDQIRNLDKGLITTFNSDGEIYHQAIYGNIVNSDEGLHHDFRHKMEVNYDENEKTNFEVIKDEIS